MGKAERGSVEVLSIFLENADVFLTCSAGESRRLWSATTVKGTLTVSVAGRIRALAHIRTLLESSGARALISPSTDAEPESDNPTDMDPSSESLQNNTRSTRPRGHSQQQVLDLAFRTGRLLTEGEQRLLSSKQREAYDSYLRAQQQELKALGKLKKPSAGHQATAPPTDTDARRRPPISGPSDAPSSSSASGTPPTTHSVHWKGGIPSVEGLNLSQSSSSSARHLPRKPRSTSKRKATSSMDEDSDQNDRREKSSKESAHSSSDSSESESSDSLSDHSGSSSDLLSSSDTSSSSDSDSDHSPRRRSSRSHHSSKHSRRRRRRHHSPKPDSTSSGLRRFLAQLGVATNKRSITTEVLNSMNGQAPVQWWRNIVSGLPSGADTRTVNEGLHLAMCLQAGSRASYIRELICRRLLGLHLVLSSLGGNSGDAWRNASALLPLNAMSSVSLPVQQLMERQARRSRHSSSSQSYRGPSFQRYTRRGRGGRGRGGHFGGYNSGTDRYDNYGSSTHSTRGRGGVHGRSNSHSGAPSASSHRGSSAGGPGARNE